jgi:N-acetylneuraminate lyase
MKELKGILPALVTPINAAGKFQSKPYEQLMARFYAAGVNGVYVCGQTGEGLQLSIEARQAAAECAIHHSPSDATVIVHVGAFTTNDAILLAQHAAWAGADYISSLPPFGNYSFEEIKAYYTAVAAASKAPLLVYYFPSLCAAIHTTDQILELCAIPNVIGLKYTDSDLFRLWAIRKTGAVVFFGRDEMLISGLIMGANGGIGGIYNLIPDSFVQLNRLVSAGKWEEARPLQNQINEFIQVLLMYPFGAVKQVLRWTGIDCGDCVRPKLKLTSAEQESLRANLLKTELGHKLLNSL